MLSTLSASTRRTTVDRCGLAVAPILPKSLEDSLFMGAKLPPFQRVRESHIYRLLESPVWGERTLVTLLSQRTLDFSQVPVLGPMAHFFKTLEIDNHENR